MNPMLVDSPTFFPGTCVDGRQDGPVVDTFYEPPGYGRLYLSRQMLRDCTRLHRGTVEELAGELGWTPPAEHHAAVSKLEQRVAELEGRLAELEPVERALTAAASRFRVDEEEPAAPTPARRPEPLRPSPRAAKRRTR